MLYTTKLPNKSLSEVKSKNVPPGVVWENSAKHERQFYKTWYNVTHCRRMFSETRCALDEQ